MAYFKVNLMICLSMHWSAKIEIQATRKPVLLISLKRLTGADRWLWMARLAPCTSFRQLFCTAALRSPSHFFLQPHTTVTKNDSRNTFLPPNLSTFCSFLGLWNKYCCILLYLPSKINSTPNIYQLLLKRNHGEKENTTATKAPRSHLSVRCTSLKSWRAMPEEIGLNSTSKGQAGSSNRRCMWWK